MDARWGKSGARFPSEGRTTKPRQVRAVGGWGAQAVLDKHLHPTPPAPPCEGGEHGEAPLARTCEGGNAFSVWRGSLECCDSSPRRTLDLVSFFDGWIGGR